MTTGAEALAGVEPAAETPVIEGQATPVAEMPAAPAPVDKPWYADIVPADKATYVEGKHWKGPSDLFDSYVSLEKTLGLPADVRADTLLIKPKADAKPEETEAFLTKALVGYVPEKAADYDVGIKAEEMPPEVQTSLDWMHAAGTPQPIAAKIVAEYQKSLAAGEAVFEKQSIEDMKSLAGEFGDKFNDMAELGRRAFKAAEQDAGLTKEQVGQIERVIGTKALMKLFIAQGRNLVENPGGGAPGNSGNSNGGFQVSAEGAKAQIQGKFNDSEFMARYNSPNQATRQSAIAEMERLQKIATGTA
jgi:hypothetical protein